MARIVVWFCVLVVVLVAQTQNSDKVDVKTFLENIKKMLQETVEKMRKQQENRMKRRKDKKNKIKTKKMIINKLANPYVSLRRQHTIININPPSNRDNLQDNNNRIDVNTGRISNQTINNVLKSNPVFNPFRTDRLKDILSKIQRPQGNVQGNVQNSSTSSGATAPDPQTLRYERELYNWLDEVYSKIDWFWNMVYRLFIMDEKRFEYLNEVLCKGEIVTSGFNWGYSPVQECSGNNLPDRFSVINLLNPTNMPCDSLEPHKLRVATGWLGEVITCVEDKYIRWSIHSGQCTPSLYKNTRLIGNKGQSKVLKAGGIRPAYTSDRSLCYNLAALNFFAYKNELRNILLPYFSYTKEEKINYISSKAKIFISYIQFMEKIFIGKMFPAAFDMCYVQCLCEDLGIKCKRVYENYQKSLSVEEAITLFAWNILKKDIYILIDQVYKLNSFKNNLESGNVSICDSGIRENLKNIINIDEDVLKKIYKISSWKFAEIVDKSELASVMKLVEDVKRKFPGIKKAIRETLIKLWQERAENLRCIDDLSNLIECTLDDFKKLINEISINNKNALEFYLSDLFNINSIKIKGLSKFIKMVNNVGILHMNLPFSVWDMNDLFERFSVFDYSIYILTAAFNALKCAMDSVTIKEFLGYLRKIQSITQDDVDFLKCFIEEGNTFTECAGDKYSIIESAIGEVRIDNIGALKDKLDKLNANNKKWIDFSDVANCCGKECENITVQVTKWCEALISSRFRGCCKNPLEQCSSSTEPFCLADEPRKIDCNSYSDDFSTKTSPCAELATTIKSLFNISYTRNTKQRKILCDVIENYQNFCSEPVKFISSIRDDSGKIVIDNAGYFASIDRFVSYGKFKCECVKCSLVNYSICNGAISVDYSRRQDMEKLLTKIGLLSEAEKMIKDGLLSKNLGKCPFQ